MTETLMIAVLAGGEGRRMGGVKALRPFRGRPLVAHALELARRWSDEVVVAVRSPDQVAGAVDAPLVLDHDAIEGPLAGLAAALAYAQASGAGRLLTLPVDMPDAPLVLRARLEAALTPAHEVALPEVAGDLQPVCGLWRTRTLQGVPAYVAAGRRSLRGFAGVCGVAIATFGPEDAAAFANANTLEELERLDQARGR